MIATTKNLRRREYLFEEDEAGAAISTVMEEFDFRSRLRQSQAEERSNAYHDLLIHLAETGKAGIMLCPHDLLLLFRQHA